MSTSKLSSSLPVVFHQISFRASARQTPADRAALRATLAGEFGRIDWLSDLRAAGWRFETARIERECVEGPTYVPALIARRNDETGAYTWHRIPPARRRAVARFILAEVNLCAISRPTETSTPDSGRTRTWKTVARDVHFRLTVADQAADGATHIALFETIEDVQPGDQIVWGEQVFEVTGQIVSSGDLANRVTCVEIGAARPLPQ